MLLCMVQQKVLNHIISFFVLYKSSAILTMHSIRSKMLQLCECVSEWEHIIRVDFVE